LPAELNAPGADGLVNLRRRVDEMRGRLEINSQPESGTSITITVPLSEE
jgi:signal transduction histidine kinase